MKSFGNKLCELADNMEIGKDGGATFVFSACFVIVGAIGALLSVVVAIYHALH